MFICVWLANILLIDVHLAKIMTTQKGLIVCCIIVANLSRYFDMLGNCAKKSDKFTVCGGYCNGIQFNVLKLFLVMTKTF